MKWLKGLLSAFIGGAATGFTVMVVSPEDFNFEGGIKKLGIVCLLSGMSHAAMYIKESPLK